MVLMNLLFDNAILYPPQPRILGSQKFQPIQDELNNNEDVKSTRDQMVPFMNRLYQSAHHNCIKTAMNVYLHNI